MKKERFCLRPACILWPLLTVLFMQFACNSPHLIIEACTDPVCGKKLDAKNALTVQYKQKDYYFDSPVCKDSFQKDPARYSR
jgi:YHS domain-containing protein